MIAAVCGYMAGLIGASNSPISGVGILSVLGISLILAAFPGPRGRGRDQGAGRLRLVRDRGDIRRRDDLERQFAGPEDRPAGRRNALAPAILADPRRDLRGGGYPADPRPDEQSFGFVGAAGAGPDALAAPQAALISAIAQGVLGGTLDWGLIGLGALIGVAVVISTKHCARKEGLPAAARCGHGHLPADGVTL